MKPYQIIQLPKIVDPRGNLTFIEGQNHIPFSIARTFWIYDVPGGETRGGHAYKSTEEFIIALSGSFDVQLDNGLEKKTYSLNRSYFGLYIPAGTWRQMENFSTNALALVLASTSYDKNDYIREYKKFLDFNLLKHKKEKVKAINYNSSQALLPTKTTVSDCKIIELDINHRDKGNITVVENNQILPFNVKRVYYLYDVPGGEMRGGHAHKNLQQLIIAASGSFDVVLHDGNNKRTIHLNRSYNCLYITPGIWREITNFSSGSICLVLASEIYEEKDYIRDFAFFLNFKN